MTTRPGGRSERVRHAVLDAVLDELAEHGVAEFAVERVAARAGVNKTSIYRRWGGRDALIDTALRSGVPDVGSPPDTGSLRGDLLTFGRAYLAALSDERSLAVTRAVTASTDARIVAARRAVFDIRRSAFATIIERARERGELRRAVDVDLVVEMVFGGAQLRALLGDRPLDADHVEATVDFVCRALGVAETDPGR